MYNQHVGSYVVGTAPPQVWARRLGARFDPGGPAAHKLRFAGFRMPYRLQYGAAPPPLPARIDLRASFGPINNQLYNCCVAESLSAAYAYAAMKTTGYKSQETGNSRLFLYYQARATDGMENQDAGAFIGSGAQSLVASGMCEENYHPYSAGPFVKPNKVAYTDALDHRAVTVRMVDQSLPAIKELLASGYPVTIGFQVFPSIQSASVEATGDIPIPSTGERSQQPIGGHAVVLVGYDDATQRFLLRNSWGTNWGQQGYGSLPYAYVLDSFLSQDFWVILSVNDDSVTDNVQPQPLPPPQPQPQPPLPPPPQPQPEPYVQETCCETCDPCFCCCARSRMQKEYGRRGGVNAGALVAVPPRINRLRPPPIRRFLA